MRKIKMLSKSLLVLTIAGLGFVACDSHGPGDSPDADTSDVFVSTDDSTGTISLSVKNEELSISETSSFSVNVRDAQGTPVPQMRISCDTERGLALIEPNSGTEMTDQWGHMSGVVGCEAPGSFQMACRLPIGGNKRQFAIVKCNGETPPDFTGFGNAGGGGLGGGVADTDSESDEALRMTGITFSLDGSGTSTGFTVDTVQGTCEDSDGDLTAEPFWDTVAVITVSNDTTSSVRFTSYQYKVIDGNADGSDFESDSLALLGDFEIAAGGDSGTANVLFGEANGGGKRFVGASSNISNTGFFNVKFTLFGTNLLGEDVSISATTSVSLGNYNNCS